MSIALRDIPGLAELLSRSHEVETATREDAWIGSTAVIAGCRVRVMTVRDYTALLQFESPLLNRALPTPGELAFFLWVLSPEVEQWHDAIEDGRGWRRFGFLKSLQQWQSRRHGKKVRRVLRLEEIERAEKEWHNKAKTIPFTLPDDAPFTIAVKEAFEYVDAVFRDKPAGLRKDGTNSGLCYLTSWFDMMQSEYHLPTQEVWKMRLPILFARIKAIALRHNQKIPEFNPERDRILQNIAAGLQQKIYTEDDLRAGRVDLENNRLKLN